MKILHIITSLHTGGAEVLVTNMLPRFQELGHEVGLVIFNGERTLLLKRLKSDCPRCQVYSLGTSYYNPWYIIKLIGIMRQYDVVHTHNSSPQLYAVIANLFCKKKMVTTEHSTNNRKREKGGILRLIDKWMYRHYDYTVCISKIAEETLRKYLYNGRAKIITINNGVDVERIHHAEPIAEMKSLKFVTVMVAGFREAKDQDTLIKAMEKLPQEKYELWLVGDGARKNDLETLVSNLGCSGQVKFLGIRSDVPNILKTADVVVMSSHWEGLSLSNIEGMSAGKPFIASDVNGLREVTDGYGILFPHGDSERLAEVIKDLSEDKAYYENVATRCYERAKRYDMQTMIEQYNEIYQSLISRN